MVSAAITDHLHRVERELLRFPNVTGVGLGWKERRGAITDTPAWRVYVRRKLPRAQLRAADLVPARVGGVATDVLPAAGAVKMVGLDGDAGPLATGAVISNLRAVLNSGGAAAGSGLGRLGFLAAINGKRTREVVLVSNRHVLLAHGAGPGDAIYRPVFVRAGDRWTIRGDLLQPIARILDEGEEGNYRFQYPKQPPDDYFVDCATARVVGAAPRCAAVRGVARVHPLDVLGRRSPCVRKLVDAGAAPTGRVVDVSAPVEIAGRQRRNNVVIRGSSGAFVEPGDSGALVVNDRNEAIALVWGRNDRDPSIAYACHIHPVLHRLDVTLMHRGLS